MLGFALHPTKSGFSATRRKSASDTQKASQDTHTGPECTDDRLRTLFWPDRAGFGANHSWRAGSRVYLRTGRQAAEVAKDVELFRK